MAKSDLAARPIYHRTKDSIEAHLTIVFAALAVSSRIEDTTGWSIPKFVKTLRRYRTVQIQAGAHTITAADALPDDVHTALDAINDPTEGHQFEPTRALGGHLGPPVRPRGSGLPGIRCRSRQILATR